MSAYPNLPEDHIPWIAAMEAAGHKPRLDGDGDINYFVQDSGYHNGPGCVLCGANWCWHCKDAADIQPCSGVMPKPEPSEVDRLKLLLGDMVSAFEAAVDKLESLGTALPKSRALLTRAKKEMGNG